MNHPAASGRGIYQRKFTFHKRRKRRGIQPQGIQRLLAIRGAKESKRGVSGSLKEMSSTDFIQSLSAGEKDVEISLEHMGEKGRIYMQKGQIVDANTGGLSGEEAFVPLELAEGQVVLLQQAVLLPRSR